MNLDNNDVFERALLASLGTGLRVPAPAQINSLQQVDLQVALGEEFMRADEQSVQNAFEAMPIAVCDAAPLAPIALVQAEPSI